MRPLRPTRAIHCYNMMRSHQAASWNNLASGFALRFFKRITLMRDVRAMMRAILNQVSGRLRSVTRHVFFAYRKG